MGYSHIIKGNGHLIDLLLREDLNGVGGTRRHCNILRPSHQASTQSLQLECDIFSATSVVLLAPNGAESLAAGAPSRTPLGELTTLPQTP